MVSGNGWPPVGGQSAQPRAGPVGQTQPHPAHPLPFSGARNVGSSLFNKTVTSLIPGAAIFQAEGSTTPRGGRHLRRAGHRGAQRSRPPRRPQAPPAPPVTPRAPRLPLASPYRPSSRIPSARPHHRGRFARLPPTPFQRLRDPAKPWTGPGRGATLGRPPARADESTPLGTVGSQGLPGLARPRPCPSRPPLLTRSLGVHLSPGSAGEALGWDPRAAGSQAAGRG